MAVIPYVEDTVNPFRDTTRLLWWRGLAAGDTGQPYVSPQKSDKTVQVKGTFGGGGVDIEGTLEREPAGDSDWDILEDQKGTALTFTSQDSKVIVQNMYLVRPKAGAGVVSVDVGLLVVK